MLLLHSLHFPSFPHLKTSNFQSHPKKDLFSLFPNMKLTPPSSSSSSSSSLSGMSPTSKMSVFGCLSFVFRRILCTKTLPTRPFNQLKETEEFQNHKPEAPPTPNLVARLMGLDPMPEAKSHRGFPRISRSKSTNSAVCRLVEETGEVQGKHRRLKTSVSFRETPSYFELEDDDFLVLRFENGRRSKRLSGKRAKSEVGGEKVEHRRRRIQIIESEGRNRTKRREEFLVEGEVEMESDESENLSPVSVLDHSLFMGDHEELHTSEEETTTTSTKSRRKLSSQMSNLQRPLSNLDDEAYSKGDHDKEVNEAIEVDTPFLERKDYHSHQNIEILNQICKLAESELVNLEWECKNNLIRNLEKWNVSIGVELGLWIVEQLVDEVIYQLL